MNGIRQICSVWQGHLKKRNIHLTLKGPESERWNISLQALNTVLSELIQNSIDHACPGCVEKQELSHDSDQPDMEIHIELFKTDTSGYPGKNGKGKRTNRSFVQSPLPWIIDYCMADAATRRRGLFP